MKIQFDKFTIKQCSIDYLEEILRMQEEAILTLPSADLLRKNTPEMLRSCLLKPHFTIGAFYEDILAAISILYVPGDSEENLAQYLVGVDKDGLKTANYKLCIVREQFRGNRLQYNLGVILEQYAVEENVKLICATVSPKNSHSIHNIIELGFIYNRTIPVQKYGGVERNLYYKFI